jgi:hypothetical protein
VVHSYSASLVKPAAQTGGGESLSLWLEPVPNFILQVCVPSLIVSHGFPSPFSRAVRGRRK